MPIRSSSPTSPTSPRLPKHWPVGLRKHLKHHAFAAAVTVGLTCAACGGGGSDEAVRVDTRAAQAALDTFRAASARPGMSATVASDTHILWSGSSGNANVAGKQQPAESTPYFTASVGKLITSTAAMQLVESGRLSLDTDISVYLGYRVENPAFPGQVMTLRHLLAHVSGIQDDAFVAIPKRLVEFPNRDPDFALQAFCREMMDKDGAFYSTASFAPVAPQTARIYSNVGYAVAGCVVEAAAKEDFALLTKRTIFAPLGMNSTSWRLADFNLGALAVRYADDGEPLPVVSYADYPNGGLFSTTRDMAVFMKAMLDDGKGIVTKSSVAEMLRTQYPELDDGSANTGLGWQTFADAKGDTLFGHAGADPGSSNFAGMNPRTNTTAVVFSNRNFVSEQDLADYLTLLQDLLEIGARR